MMLYLTLLVQLHCGTWVSFSRKWVFVYHLQSCCDVNEEQYHLIYYNCCTFVAHEVVMLYLSKEEPTELLNQRFKGCEVHWSALWSIKFILMWTMVHLWVWCQNDPRACCGLVLSTVPKGLLDSGLVLDNDKGHRWWFCCMQYCPDVESYWFVIW